MNADFLIYKANDDLFYFLLPKVEFLVCSWTCSLQSSRFCLVKQRSSPRSRGSALRDETNDCVEHYMYCTCNFLSFFLWSFFSDSPCTQLSVLNVPVSQWFSTIVNFLCCFPHKISTPGQSGDLGPKGYEVSQFWQQEVSIWALHCSFPQSLIFNCNRHKKLNKDDWLSPVQVYNFKTNVLNLSMQAFSATCTAYYTPCWIPS